MGDNDDLKEVYDELNQMIGLESIKQSMGQLYATSLFRSWRKLLGFEMQKQSFHMAFLGNPGTGKTHVAKIVGKMLVKLGLIKGDTDDERASKKTDDERASKKTDGGVHMVTRADLVAGYLGQTAPLVVKHVQESMGGVMFIDEAYALVSGEGDDFGQAAVDTLIQEMENKRDKVVIILAGYEKNMDRLFNFNPGFKSRVPFRFIFPDYTCEELKDVAQLYFKQTSVTIAPESNTEVMTMLKKMIKVSSGCCDTTEHACHPNPNSGNARTVRNVFEEIVRKFAVRLADDASASDIDRMTAEDKQLFATDVQEAIKDRVEGFTSSVCGAQGTLAKISQEEGLVSNVLLGSETNVVSEFQQLVRLLISSLSEFGNTHPDSFHGCVDQLERALQSIESKMKTVCGTDGSLERQIEELGAPGTTSSFALDDFTKTLETMKQAADIARFLHKLVDEDLSKEVLPTTDKETLQKIFETSKTCKTSLNRLTTTMVMAPLTSALKSVTSMKVESFE